MQRLPYFTTHAEVWNLVHQAWNNKFLRPGQALCNRYRIPPELANRIYEEKDSGVVIQRVWNYYRHEAEKGNHWRQDDRPAQRAPVVETAIDILEVAASTAVVVDALVDVFETLSSSSSSCQKSDDPPVSGGGGDFSGGGADSSW